MDKLNELELAEINGMDIEEDGAKERFSIQDRDQLGWAMRKIKALEAERTELAEYAEKELNRIKEWHQAESSKLERDKEFFQSLIMIYAMTKRNEDGAFKSESTPYGKVTFKKQAAKWTYQEDDLLSWLMESDNIDLINVERKPRKDDIKKRFTVQGESVIDASTGEKVPGIQVLEQPEKIDIKIL